MKKIIVLLSLFSTLSMADTVLGGEINLGFYTHSPKGTLEYQGNSIDIIDTLNWETSSDIVASLYFEHPIPMLPNLKLGYSSLDNEGKERLSQEISFAGQHFSANTEVTSGLALKITDTTLYYELADNWISIDFGLTAKYLDGSAYVESSVTKERKSFTAIIPLVYSKLRFEIPTTDIAFQMEGNYVAYENTIVYDIEAGIRYTVMLGAGVEIGYKQIKLKIDDIKGFNMDSDFSGLYGKLVWDF